MIHPRTAEGCLKEGRIEAALPEMQKIRTYKNSPAVNFNRSRTKDLDYETFLSFLRSRLQ